MVPILKYLFLFITTIILLFHVQGLKCNNFNDQKTFKACQKIQKQFQNQKINYLTYFTPQKTLNLAKDYNKDIKSGKFNKFFRKDTGRFFESGLVYIRKPFKSVKYNSTIYSPASGTLKIETRLNKGLNPSKRWISFNEDFCSDEYKVKDYKRSLNNFINGKKVGSKNKVNYNVNERLRVKSILKGKVKLKVLKKFIEYTEKGNIICKVSDINTRTLTTNFKDVKTFAIADASRITSFYKRPFSTKVEIKSSAPIMKASISDENSKITFKRTGYNLSLNNLGKLAVKAKRDLRIINYSNIEVKSYKERKNNLLLNVKGLNNSKCKVKVTSLSKTKKEYKCRFKHSNKVKIKVGEVQRFNKNGKQYINVSLKQKNSNDSTKVLVSFNDLNKEFKFSDSTNIVLPIDGSGFLSIEAKGTSYSKSIFVTESRPEVLASNILVIILSLPVLMFLSAFKSISLR